MEKTQIIILSAAMAFLAIRIYQKYIKKDTDKAHRDTKTSTGSAFTSSSGDDDYEPYSKK